MLGSDQLREGRHEEFLGTASIDLRYVTVLSIGRIGLNRLGEGKPGYGKTVLCSQIVEDLQTLVATKSSFSGTGAGLVAYFYFTSLEADFRQSGTAFRAVLAQILQARRLDPEFIDIGSLLHNNGEGQNKASDKEVREIFHLCLGV